MYRFHYDYMRAKYGGKYKLLFTDKDSLCYVMECDDFYKDMCDNKEGIFDLSNFEDNPQTNRFQDKSNKKVCGILIYRPPTASDASGSSALFVQHAFCIDSHPTQHCLSRGHGTFNRCLSLIAGLLSSQPALGRNR